MMYSARTCRAAASAFARVANSSTASAAFTRSTARLASAFKAAASSPLRASYRSFSSTASRASRTSSSSSSSSSPSWLRHVAFGVAGCMVTLALSGESNVLDACGIIAFIGEEPAVPYLLEGLHILQNRGYDSAGVTTINADGELVTTKYASVGSTSDSIELLKNDAPGRHPTDVAGIAHTRWATHGGKTDANAHPHLDQHSRVAVVHNGTIENSGQLKLELEAQGVIFKSQTDTEVIVQLIGHYLDQNVPILDAVKKTLSRLEGTWGLAIIHKDNPHQIIAARNGSPLCIGLGKNRMFVASELAAFSRHTNEYISLKDGEVAVINSSGTTLDLSRMEKAPEEVIELDPKPYPYWTIKEIMEQPEAISRTLNYGGRFAADGGVKLGGFEANHDMLLSIRHLVIAACGTSLFAGAYGALLFKSLKCFDTVSTIDAAEVTPDTFPLEYGGLLVLSQSGETKDTHRSLRTAEDLAVPTFSVVNQVGSLIARTTNCGVYVNAGREHAVASTKAFTTQVTALALVAGWYAQNRHASQSKNGIQRRTELIEAIHRLPIYSGMTLRSHEQVRELAARLQGHKSMFILGKGYAEPIAREAALKIKEIAYTHAEGFSGGALKHGPFALLEDGTPVVLIILDDQNAELMRIAAAEVRARGAHTIIVTDKRQLAHGLADERDTIVVPSNGPLSALLAVIPLQLLAYEMALKNGINPDKPRHLAKAVTVD